MEIIQRGGFVYEAIVASIIGFAVFFVLLLLVIVVSKVWREYLERRNERRRQELEPVFFKYVTGEGPITDYLPRKLYKSERDLVQKIFFDLGRVVKGSIWSRAREAFEDLGFVDYYLNRLESSRWWARAEAAEKLGYIKSEKATEALIRHMEDPSPEVRVRVARALGKIGSNASLDCLVEALHHPARWSAIRVSGILIDAGDHAVEALMRAFSELPLHARIASIDIFGRIRSLKALPHLRLLLGNKESDIRARAAYALGGVGDPSAASDLIKALQDEDWAVRAMAAKALGRLKEEKSIEPLCVALADSEWWVRANAAEALRNKGDKGNSALLSMLDSDDTFAAHQAVQRLQESGMLDGMISRLASQSEEERQGALQVMAKLVMLQRTDLLTEMAHNHPEATIRQRLQIVLGLKAQPAT